MQQQTPFLDITEEAFDWVMEINTKGVFLGMKAQLEVLCMVRTLIPCQTSLQWRLVMMLGAPPEGI